MLTCLRVITSSAGSEKCGCFHYYENLWKLDEDESSLQATCGLHALDVGYSSCTHKGICSLKMQSMRIFRPTVTGVVTALVV